MDNVYSAPFLEPVTEGVFVNLETVSEYKPFLTYVNEIFDKGFFFSGLNYEAFHGILYDFDDYKAKNGRVFLAKTIVEPPLERKPLYERFKVIKDAASYEFGPIYCKSADGEETAASITFDELVAAAWRRQIRFGLLVEEIRQKIKRDFKGIGVIAQPSLPVRGRDARLEYLVKIKKDLTPVEDPKTGRLDLKRCKCSFPRIPEPVPCKIVRKFNATKGTPGFSLNGNRIPPQAGLDIDLRALAAEGTEVIVENNTEHLVANCTGYIIVEPCSNKISITLDPQNHSPIGPETGSLEIRSDHFTQHGDILNGYSVKCRSIIVVGGNVNGEVLSEKGDIEVRGNVNSGRLINQDGNILVKGIVSLNSHLESLNGDIIVDTAENSMLIGKNISVRFAVNCHIVGENITIGTVRSSMIRGLAVQIENSETSDTSSENTDIIIPVLDMTDKRIRSITQILEEKRTRLKVLEQKITELKENSVLLAFLQAMKAKDEQAINALRRHATPIANEISKLSKESDSCKEETADVEKRLNELQEEHDRDIDYLQKVQKCTILKPLKANISLKLYGGLDWPLHLERLLRTGEEATFRCFIELIEHLTKGFSNYKRRGYVQVLNEPCSYDHFGLLKLYEKAQIIEPAKAKGGPVHRNDGAPTDFRESLVSVISEEEFRCFVKEHKWPLAKQSIEITVDGIFKGHVYDFNTSELSIFFDKGQRWRPNFERGEKIKLVATVFGEELKYDLIIFRIDEKSDLLLVRGNFINISSEDEDRLYKLKNRYEVLRKSADQRG